jgi:hypothetical protein
LRELMVYQSPPELGALYTEVEAMMKHMGQTQRVLIAKQMQNDHATKIRRRKRIQKLRTEIAIGLGGLALSVFIGLLMVYVINDRIKKYPQLGTEWIPKTEEQRRIEAAPKIWIGR